MGDPRPAGVAKQTGEFVNDVTTARAEEGSNFAAHSQGNLLMQAGIEYRKENGGFQSAGYFTDFTKPEGSPERYKGLPTVGMFGSPVNTKDMEMTVRSVDFSYRDAVTHDGDWVGEALGGNKGKNGQMGAVGQAAELFNVWDIGRLFAKDSPHSTYLCSQNPSAKCGEQP